jgi:hypothetical protein
MIARQIRPTALCLLGRVRATDQDFMAGLQGPGIGDGGNCLASMVTAVRG